MKEKMVKADGIFEACKEEVNTKEGTMKGELEAIRKKIEEVETGFVKEITQAGKLHREDVAKLREGIQEISGGEGGGKGGGGGRGYRPILECKAIGSIKNLDSGRDGFREWEEKFINVMGQAKEKADVLLEWLAKEADARPRDGGGYAFASEGKERALEHLVYEESMSRFSAEKLWDEVGKDVYIVLREKTSGEARSIIRGRKKGEGLEALRDVHAWFTETTKAGMAERRIAIMSPAQAKKDEEVLGMVTRWMDTHDRLQQIDGQEMPTMYKATAVKKILPGKFKEHLDMTMGNSFGEKDEGDFKRLINHIKQWATARKLEKTKKKEIYDKYNRNVNRENTKNPGK